jgi:hypothetical protein
MYHWEYQGIMKKLLKIVIIFGVMILSHRHMGFAQNYFAQADTSMSMRDKTESKEMSEGKGPQENRQEANKGKSYNQQPAKKVKSARPDMSKARGARPAYIQRQSGSGIPRGIGKPAGAGAVKPGKR